MPGPARLHVIPLPLATANALVAEWHRHHRPARGHKFSLGAVDDAGRLHGAIIVGRPVARRIDHRTVVEVTRLVTDGTPNACSMLYGAAARAAKALGYQRIQTYILDTEPGVTLRASGWQLETVTKGGKWSYGTRGGADAHPTGPKQRWARELNPAAPVLIEASA